jgi:pyruvate,water dikinase
MLFRDEIERALDDPSWASRTIAERYDHYHHLQTIEPPFLINGMPPPIEEWPLRSAATYVEVGPGDTIQGVPGSSGVYRGIARVVLDPSDPTVLGPGDILVAPHTDPAWTPLFVPAGAVVVDVGAALSHAIIVSRELGLPCVVSATDATHRIPDGAEIEVNGDTGAVTIVSVPA